MDSNSWLVGFELLTRGFELVTRGFELVTCGFELVTHVFELGTRGFFFSCVGMLPPQRRKCRGELADLSS